MTIPPLAQRMRELRHRYPRMMLVSGTRAGPNKKAGEVAVAAELVELVSGAGARELGQVWPRAETGPATPPDVLARDARGGLIGIEVTELVNQEAIQLNIPIATARDVALRSAQTSQERVKVIIEHDERVWVPTAEELRSLLQSMIAVKDRNEFVADGEAYAERWLIIHTSEPLVWHALIEAIRTWAPPELLQLDRVYLLGRPAPPPFGTPWRLILTRTP